MDRLMHRHGDEWREMTPVSSQHSPVAGDPERELLHGQMVYRCTECDEEMAVVPPEAPR
jgi:hypothetical protein